MDVKSTSPLAYNTQASLLGSGTSNHANTPAHDASKRHQQVGAQVNMQRANERVVTEPELLEQPRQSSNTRVGSIIDVYA